MGGALTKCSDVSRGNQMANGAIKPLEASSSEEEEDDVEDDEEDDSLQGDDEIREAAEDALNEGLKPGKTKIFKEAIEHAAHVGIDADKILKAEAKLEEHKAIRRREAFELDIKDYLDNEESQDIEVLREKLTQGTEYACSEKLLKMLRERIDLLDVNRPLEDDEVRQILDHVESLARSFMAAAVVGRPTSWVDLDSGDAIPALLFVDLVLQNARVLDNEQNEIAACSLSKMVARKATNMELVNQRPGFEALSDDEQRWSVGVIGDANVWCFLEPDGARRDEVICAFMVLTGLGVSQDAGKKPRGQNMKMGTKDGDESFPVSPRVKKEAGARHKADSPRSNDGSDAPAASPRRHKKHRDTDTKEKKSKKEKKHREIQEHHEEDDEEHA